MTCVYNSESLFVCLNNTIDIRTVQPFDTKFFIHVLRSLGQVIVKFWKKIRHQMSKKKCKHRKISKKKMCAFSDYHADTIILINCDNNKRIYEYYILGSTYIIAD